MAIPGMPGSERNNDVNASSPPADAPTPTIVRASGCARFCVLPVFDVPDDLAVARRAGVGFGARDNGFPGDFCAAAMRRL
jgi:hypothetical protein